MKNLIEQFVLFITKSWRGEGAVFQSLTLPVKDPGHLQKILTKF